MSLYETYFEWLYDKTELPSEGDDSYILLCTELFKREWNEIKVEDDLNRIMDGAELRSLFLEEFEIDPMELENELGPINFLEVILAICDHLAFMTEDCYHIYTTSGWFMELLRNTGLYYYSDIIFHEHSKSTSEVLDILRIIEGRFYTHNGVGGLFPLTESYIDMRKAPLWEQMHTYLLEKVF